MGKIIKRTLLMVAVVLVFGPMLSGCSKEGGRDYTIFETYRVTEVELTDGRTIECVYFGSHNGYDCNWDQ